MAWGMFGWQEAVRCSNYRQLAYELEQQYASDSTWGYGGVWPYIKSWGNTIRFYGFDWYAGIFGIHGDASNIAMPTLPEGYENTSLGEDYEAMCKIRKEVCDLHVKKVTAYWWEWDFGKGSRLSVAEQYAKNKAAKITLAGERLSEGDAPGIINWFTGEDENTYPNRPSGLPVLARSRDIDPSS